jgi:hypothetical protein
MGATTFDPSAYVTYSTATARKTVRDYTATYTKPAMDPKMIKVRESVASVINPKPTPVIVGLDVSGSMGRVVEAMRRGLGTLFEETIKRKPVSDPHVLAMAIGDMSCDRSPVQATQFEGDPVTIGTQIEELHLEGGGGANNHESYLGPLYFALQRTSCDAFKEGRKGYIFTVGDEQPQQILTVAEIERWFGDQAKKDYTAAELIASVERNWHYFHLMVEEGAHMGYDPDRTIKEWRELLGQRAILLSDHKAMAETIISIVEVTEGRDKDAVAHSWSGDKSLVVAKAISGLPTAKGDGGTVLGPVTF